MIRDDFTLWQDDCYVVDSEGLRAYARATRFAHVPYADSRRMPADSAVPPLIVATPVFKVAARLMADAIDGFNISRVLHIAQTVRQVTPLRIGDVVSLGGRISSRMMKAGLDIFEVDCVVTATDGTRIETSSTVAYATEADIPVEAIDAASADVLMHGAVL